LFDRIAIIGAMEGEIGFLRNAMAPPDLTREKCAVGNIESKTIMLLRSGVGPHNTARRLAEAAKLRDPQCVLSIGCAGALGADIEIGDAVIPDKIIDDASVGATYIPSSELICTAKDCCRELGFRFHSGTTVSTSEVAATIEAKESLAARHGAIAVDMETAQVAAWAKMIGAPMLALRTISDTSADRIPPEIGSIIDPRGKLRPAKALALFGRRPKLLPEAVRLKRNMNRSLQALERIVLALLQKI